MSEIVIRKTVVVTNPQGLHARPAYLFAELAGSFQSNVEIEKDGERVDGKSILSIMTLAAEQGTEILIVASGPDATKAIDALAGLVEQDFPDEEAAESA